MSIVNTPVQSFAGDGEPPELTEGVRRTCDLTHNVPPWNGSAVWPLTP
jgi:hypothetical protein